MFICFFIAIQHTVWREVHTAFNLDPATSIVQFIRKLISWFGLKVKISRYTLVRPTGYDLLDYVIRTLFLEKEVHFTPPPPKLFHWTTKPLNYFSAHFTT